MENVDDIFVLHEMLVKKKKICYLKIIKFQMVLAKKCNSFMLEMIEQLQIFMIKQITMAFMLRLQCNNPAHLWYHE